MSHHIYTNGIIHNSAWRLFPWFTVVLLGSVIKIQDGMLDSREQQHCGLDGIGERWSMVDGRWSTKQTTHVEVPVPVPSAIGCGSYLFVQLQLRQPSSSARPRPGVYPTLYSPQPRFSSPSHTTTTTTIYPSIADSQLFIIDFIYLPSPKADMNGLIALLQSRFFLNRMETRFPVAATSK